MKSVNNDDDVDGMMMVMNDKMIVTKLSLRMWQERLYLGSH